MNKMFEKISYSFTVASHISRFEGGVFKLPVFQRGFVWTKEQALLFMDSLMSDYPISSLTFAQLNRHSNDMYVLDGQQRLLSLVFLKHSVFPTEEGRIKLNKWFVENPIWETLIPMFEDSTLFENIDTRFNLMDMMSVLPSVELSPTKKISYDKYIAHIKECFKRLNLGGTSISANEIEMLFIK